MNSLHILVLVGTGTLFLVVLYGLVRVINMTEGLEWSDLISTRAKDGKEYADWNKIGQGLGVVLCVWLPVCLCVRKHWEGWKRSSTAVRALAEGGRVASD